MTIRLDNEGNLYTMNECYSCDNEGPHYSTFIQDGRPFFKCARCMGPVSDTSPAPSTWLPGRPG